MINNSNIERHPQSAPGLIWNSLQCCLALYLPYHELECGVITINNLDGRDQRPIYYW